MIFLAKNKDVKLLDQIVTKFKEQIIASIINLFQIENVQNIGK